MPRLSIRLLKLLSSCVILLLAFFAVRPLIPTGASGPQTSHLLVASTTASVGQCPHDNLAPRDVTHLKIDWTVPGAGTSKPALLNGIVYTSAGAFNAATGARIPHTGSVPSPTRCFPVYSLPRPDPGPFTPPPGTKWTVPPGMTIIYGPKTVHGVTYVGFSDQKLYAFTTLTGHLLWAAPIIDNSGSNAASIYSLLVINGVVCISDSDEGYGDVFALNATTGALLWDYSASGGGDPVLDVSTLGSMGNGLIFTRISHFNVGEYQFVVFNVKTGGGGTFPADDNGDGIMIANGVIYTFVGDAGNYKLQAYSANGYKFLWAATDSWQEGFTNLPVIENQALYLSGYDHTLYAFHVPGTIP